MDQNICHFMPFYKDTHTISIINFVLENHIQAYTHLKTDSVYKMYYVCNGKGVLHTPGKAIPVKRGDIFFTFPAFPYSIESREDFQYLYISFVGLRGNRILEDIKIDKTNFVFRQSEEVQEFWLKGISASAAVADWMSESVLMYTFAYLGERFLARKEEPRVQQSVNLIKKYVDDHFAEKKFSLEDMSKQLSYNKKYISYVFKKHFGIGIIEYLNTIRIQNACTMIDQGFTSVTDIAYSCGYSDVQYFSKIFKQRMGVAPIYYIKSKEGSEKEVNDKAGSRCE